MANEVGFSLKMHISTSLLYLVIFQLPPNQNASPPCTHDSTQQKKYGGQLKTAGLERLSSDTIPLSLEQENQGARGRHSRLQPPLPLGSLAATAGPSSTPPLSLLYPWQDRITESQNSRGWKGPLWVI